MRKAQKTKIRVFSSKHDGNEYIVWYFLHISILVLQWTWTVRFPRTHLEYTNTIQRTHRSSLKQLFIPSLQPCGLIRDCWPYYILQYSSHMAQDPNQCAQNLWTNSKQSGTCRQAITSLQGLLIPRHRESQLLKYFFLSEF